MDELTMMVQVAGGDPEVVSRLREAGLRKPKDLAEADVDEVVSSSGLTGAAARRLIKAAQRTLKPADQLRTRSPRDGLAQVTPIAPPDFWRSEAPTPSADAAALDQGVSEDESAALTGTPREETDPDSFWRFG